MALKKENYETIYGAKAEHWVIQSINIIGILITNL